MTTTMKITIKFNYNNYNGAISEIYYKLQNMYRYKEIQKITIDKIGKHKPRNSEVTRK